jgi:hypothetical protein
MTAPPPTPCSPHGHYKVLGRPRVNRITRPLLLLPGKSPPTGRLALVVWTGSAGDEALLERLRVQHKDLVGASGRDSGARVY